MASQQKYPEGHFISMWIGIGAAIGSGIGVSIAIAIGNMAFMGIGIPIGVGIGVAIGSAQEAKHQAAGLIRPPNEKEKQQQKVAKWLALGLVVVGVLILLAFLLLK